MTSASTTPANLRRMPVHLCGAVAADHDHVYYVESAPATGARIMAATSDLATKRVIVTLPEALAAVGIAIVVDATHLYWSRNDGVFAVPLAGGEVRTLLSGPDLPWGLAQDESCLYLSTLGMYPAHERGGIVEITKAEGRSRMLFAGAAATAVTVANGTAYWASGGSIWSQPVIGGTRTRIVDRARNPHSILVREGLLYFSEFDERGAVWSVPITGGRPNKLADGGHSGALVAAGAWLYFTQGSLTGSRIVTRLPFAGGRAEPIVSGIAKLPRAAASSSAFFFSHDYEGALVAFDL